MKFLIQPQPKDLSEETLWVLDEQKPLRILPPTIIMMKVF